MSNSIKLNSSWRNKFGNYECPYCGKEFSKKGICSHIGRSHTEEGKEFKPAENTTPGCKNLTKEDDNRLAKQAESMRQNIIENGSHGEGKKHFYESRKRMSNTKKEMYKNGWEVKCGRSPKYTYESKIAGSVKLDGSGELEVAKYLDSLEVNWIRNKKRFEYINLSGGISTYCPDFGVENGNTYIEVKGYKTDLDLCKGEQFPENLEVGDRDKLKELEIF